MDIPNSNDVNYCDQNDEGDILVEVDVEAEEVTNLEKGNYTIYEYYATLATVFSYVLQPLFKDKEIQWPPI